jgi:hypothetical protein
MRASICRLGHKLRLARTVCYAVIGCSPATAAFTTMTSSSNQVALEAPDPRITIRLIHDCNFRCARCSTFSGPGRSGRMRMADFSRTIDLLAGEGFHGTINVSGGETTLHPRLADMLRIAAERLPRSTVTVFTNGSWVGRRNWERRLRALAAGPNVIINYSLDRQHVEGARRMSPGRSIEDVETELFDRARRFVDACRQIPGIRFRFAFKGTAREAARYLRRLGEVPIYLIQFQKFPARRPKTPGVAAVEVDRTNRVLVFPTLGHIPRGEALGGLDTLRAALQFNREAIRKGGSRAR